VRRAVTLATLPYPARFRAAARLGHLGQRLRWLVPKPFRSMLDLLPPALPSAEPLPECVPAVGMRRARVALLAGCAQQVLAPNIGQAAVRVLTRAGVEVVTPRGQGCCGALAMHVGEDAQAKALARQNLRAFPDDVEAIVTTAAGCGSGLKEYGMLFEGAPEEARARAFASRVIDVSAFLDSLGLPDLPPLPSPVTVACQDACHLAHAQGVRAAPRALLRRIPNVTLVEIPDGGLCCGSAGTYNLDQPEIAGQLGARKAAAVLSTGADIVVSGNIGCLTQMRTHLANSPSPAPEVLHTIELLDRALRGELDPAKR
jgi:glycolate oxidase iron-sulfur subunit